MMKIWTYVFWGKPHRATADRGWHGPAAATAVLVVATLLLGIGAQPFLRLAADAAADIVAPTAYIQAVLGERSTLAAASGPTGALP
jgi:multicomponent Na+:H+ antiporter subunit D